MTHAPKHRAKQPPLVFRWAYRFSMWLLQVTSNKEYWSTLAAIHKTGAAVLHSLNAAPVDPKGRRTVVVSHDGEFYEIYLVTGKREFRV